MTTVYAPTSTTINRVAPVATSTTNLVFVPLPAKPTFRALLSGAPIPWADLAALAKHLGVDPVLFERVAARRQPLSRRLAGRIALAAGLDSASVEAVVEITSVETPVAYRPVPADRAWGDLLDFVPLAPAAPIVLP
jgi:hypothetical protein